MKYDLLNKKSWIIALIFIVMMGLFIQYPYMNEFPSYIHAWSQSDRYSLALGFVNNGLDLFHPETYIYNKQYPDYYAYPHETTITSVDFPMVEYIVAIIMTITGNTSPWIFRTCTLLFAFLGMFFLYKLSFLITKDLLKSLLVTAILITSPVYAYYFNGFIPGVPALTFAVIALYFYVRYLDEDEIKLFCLSMLFITLSVLLRTSFAVMWVALLGFELLRIFRKETSLMEKILPVAVSVVVFLSYYIWNKHLASEYGTLFLGSLRPADGWADFWANMTTANDNWQYHYFSKAQYALFSLILLLVVSYCIYKRIRKKDEIAWSEMKKPLSLWILVGASLFGNLLFAIAMAKQFPNHDYYFIDTFLLPLLMLFIMLLNSLPQITGWKQCAASCVITAAFMVFMLKEVKELQEYRRLSWWSEPTVRTLKNYQGAEQYLDSLGISKDAKILTLWAYPQNTPFIMMDRKGYTEMFDEDGMIRKGLTFDYDYVVIENDVYRDKIQTKQELLSGLEYYSDNGRITLFVKKDE